MAEWWRDAVFYQVYIRSFADSNGDGIGDFAGLCSHLDHIASLGVDAIWVTPFYPSPMADHGYDVADYRDVDPLFGTLDDADAFISEAHGRGLKVLFDVVPNHTSDQHAWFKACDFDKYIVRDPKPDGSPPNNWGSVFGGPAWSPLPDGRMYLHLFAPEQPDLDWRNPDVHAEFADVLRFWLDRGVDGFRIDVAHGLYKDELLRDNPSRAGLQGGGTQYHSLESKYNWDQPETLKVYEDWRKITDGYEPDRVLVGEVFLFDQARVADYVSSGRLHLSFNFLLLGVQWQAHDFRRAIEATFPPMDAAGSPPSWVLGNHDVTRPVTRLGSNDRAAAAALVQLGLPGVAFVYQGEELGLPEADVPDEARTDPIFARTQGQLKGRDGCRVGIPWMREEPGYGFTSGRPWLPFPSGWGDRSVESAPAELDLYRNAIAARRSLSGGLEWASEIPEDVLAFRRGDVLVACNFGDQPWTLPSGDVLVASRGDVGHELPPDTAVWLRC